MFLNKEIYKITVKLILWMVCTIVFRECDDLSVLYHY